MASHAKQIELPDDRNGFSLGSFARLYTCIFLVIATLISLFFVADHASMLMGTDGWEQHVKALAYYGRWLRAIARNFMSTKEFALPQYALSLGYGSDVIGTLHYYVLGDPLNLFSALVPAKFTPLLYGILIFLRLYLAGLAFCGFVTYTHPHAQTQEVVYAAVSYVFFGYAILFSVMHPYFSNPMIYFPLTLWGVERVMREKKPGLFTAAMFVSSVSSFYFLYMLVLLTVPYIMWRLVTSYKDNVRTLLAQGVRLLFSGILGAMMAATILLPAVIAFLSCSRASSGNTYGITYALTYYQEMLAGLSNSQIGLSSWASIGLNPLVLVGLTAVFAQPGRRGIKVASIACLVAACLPFFGSMLNGFSYPSHRWYWAASLVASYALVDVWPSLRELRGWQRALMVVPFALYAFGIWHLSRTTEMPLTGTWVAAGLTGVVLVVTLLWAGVSSESSSASAGTFLGFASVAAIVCNVFFVYSQSYGSYTNQFKTFEEASEYTTTDASAIGAFDPMTDLYRVAGDSLNINGSTLGDVSSTQYYWSVSSAAADQYYRELGNNVSLSQRMYGLDARTVLEELACVRYYKADGGWSVPRGYERVTELDGVEGIGDSQVYRNTHALPLGYTYDHIIARSTYEKMSMVDRQWALLQGVVLEKNVGIEEISPIKTSKDLATSVTAGNGARVDGNTVVVEEENAEVTITFAGEPESETYLCLEGLEFAPKDTNDSQSFVVVRYFTEETSTRGATIVYRTPYHRWFEDRHDFAINSGYSDKALTSVVVRFEKVGTYTFDHLSVVSQPMEGYEAYAAALGQEVLQDIDMHYMGGVKATNKITGTIDVSKPKVMVIALPFADGWTARVDGTERELLQANTMFFGLELEAGHHEIELTYQTPGLDWGIRLSLAGTLLSVLWLIVRVVFGRRTKQEEPEAEQSWSE